ncbi:hypothetical protein [Lysobacter sp. HA35]
MTTTQLIGLCAWFASVLLVTALITRARGRLDGDALLLIERAGPNPVVALLPIFAIGAVGYVLLTMARPHHRALIAVALVVVAILASVLTAQVGHRRMQASGVPMTFLSTWRRAQVASLALFVVGCALVFWPYVRLLSAR